jgi:transposase, IS30 family
MIVIEGTNMGQKHLNFAQRTQIEKMIQEGKSLSDIANTLGYSRATITKEVQRATKHLTDGRKITTNVSKNLYKAVTAQSYADQKQISRIRKRHQLHRDRSLKVRQNHDT